MITFEDKDVVLANGDRVPRLADVQDPASHYIQLAYQFILKPEMLKPGASIDVPLAWAKRQEVIVYNVLGEEVLDTPMGKIPTFHVRPTRLTNQPGDVLAEVWFAPSLQYLPIRMLFRQGPETFLDLRMDRAPQQKMGSPPPATVPATTRPGAEPQPAP